jgi:hypothetical protein
MNIEFKTAAEWGRWAIELGLKSKKERRAAERLGAVATGRARILGEWQNAVEQGKAKNWTRDQATNAFVRHLAKTGRGISRSSLYTWWEDYEAGGIAALVDERSLARLLKRLPQNNLAAKAAELARALQDAGVNWEMTINGVTVRGSNGRAGGGPESDASCCTALAKASRSQRSA